MGVQGIEASLAVCSHNPRPDYFRRVLAAIREQSLPKSCWELIVVDNHSAVPLSPCWDLSWHPHGRHVEENELGLSAARSRAMIEATSELLIFVDDDNVLDPNYLSEAIKIGNNFPQLGVWGSGAIIPEFEHQPEERVQDLLPYLALRDTPVPRWSNFLPCPEATPWGAGLCVRSKVAKAYCDYYERAHIPISDRQGKALLSGGDLEISYVASSIGLGIGIFPELRLTHLIPRERVSLDYLLKICEGTTISNLLLAYNWQGRKPKLMAKPQSVLSLIKTLLFRYGVERKMYFANRRAVITAYNIISHSRVS